MSEVDLQPWQTSCVTQLLPIRGKDFDMDIDDFAFGYGTGLTARIRIRPKGARGWKNARAVPGVVMAPADAFSSMAARDLDEELLHWGKWLGKQRLATMLKLDAEELAPFQPLTAEELEADYLEWKKENDPEPKKRIARQKKALDAADKRFDAFAAHVKKVWGLRVPRSLIPVRALLDFAASDWSETLAARLVLDFELSAAGVLERFAVGGLELGLQKGKDELCLGRYFRDPPELLTFLHGGEDGLHFGLWYDEDDRLPSRVMMNFSRDSGETWFAGSTPMQALVKRISEREPAPGHGDFRRRLLLEVLAWFAEADGKAPRKEPAPPPILGGWGVRCAGEASPCDDPAVADEALSKKPGVVKKWIKEAEARLAKGDARMALVLGRSMHWKCNDLSLEASGPLLEKAYAALGRKALLAITKAHYAHRRGGSVDVLEPRDSFR